VGTLVILFVVDKVIGLPREPRRTEREGLDLSQHGERRVRLGALKRPSALGFEF